MLWNRDRPEKQCRFEKKNHFLILYFLHIFIFPSEEKELIDNWRGVSWTVKIREREANGNKWVSGWNPDAQLFSQHLAPYIVMRL